MKIQLLAFASAGDALGRSRLVVELPDGASLADLRSRLHRDYPDLRPLWERLAVAVDGELAGPEAPLADGAEVALLPPVSGGSGPAGASVVTEAAGRAALTEGPLNIEGILETVSADGFGAVLLFLGTVRDNHQGQSVERLDYSAYEAMALARLERIVTELEQAHGPLRLAIVHRLGPVPVGEASVAIAAASPHRAAAYEASRRALERLKAEVPIWKREHYAGGEAAWREEEPLDRP
ncbi:MAG: molybdenum cofactor biosynthesis protein MoaE [Acidobacteriota bacterium]|nr:molybdenum cofactor biosynthesis protein MoaE [Acidobacteriota bacterium]